MSIPGEDPDHLTDHLNQGQHVLFYDPAVPIQNINKWDTLEELINIANQRLDHYGSSMFTNFKECNEFSNEDQIANIIRINLFVHSINAQGNVKPCILHYCGSLPYGAGNGGSRLMALECLPHISTISAFISAPAGLASNFSHLRQIHNTQDLLDILGKPHKTKFYFKFTYDPDAHGIDWYEVDLRFVRVPNNQQCLELLQEYVNNQPNFRFTKSWFTEHHNWPVITELPAD